MVNEKKKYYPTIMAFYYTKNMNGNMTCYINELVLEQLKKLKLGDRLLFRKVDHTKANTKVDAFVELLPPREENGEGEF